MSTAALEKEMSRAKYLMKQVRETPYIPWEPTLKQWMFLLDERKDIMYGGAAGGGKLYHNATPVLTSSGWSTHGELRSGDEVFDQNGNPVRVLRVTQEVTDCSFVMTLDNGTQAVIHGDHLWNVMLETDTQRYARAHPEFKAARRAKRPSRSKGTDSKSPWLTAGSVADSNKRRADEARLQDETPYIWDYTRTVSTLELIELMKTERRNIRIPVGGALQTIGKWELETPAYELGCWIGDGTSATGHLTVGAEDLSYFLSSLDAQSCVEDREGVFRVLVRGLTTSLRADNVLNNKTLPESIFCAPYEERLALFQGIMDTDGWCDADGSCGLSMAREELLKDIWKLAHTLGLNPSKVRYQATTNQDPNFSGHSWRFVFRTPVRVFRLPRKAARQKYTAKRGGECNSIISIEAGPVVPMRCIQVDDPRGLYRVGYEQTVTHNTIAMLMAALMHIDGSCKDGTQKYDALILRRTYADLALPGAPMDIADDWLTPTNAKRREKGTKWEFPSGATLTFGYMQTDADRLRYQSSAFHFVGYDEASQFTEAQLLYLFSRLRQSLENTADGAVPTRYRLCTNPGGPSHAFLRDRYVKRTDKDPKRLFIPATMEENPHLNLEEYKENLSELDPFTRAQLEAGDWDVEPSGNFFLNRLPVVGLHQSEGQWNKRWVQRCRAWDLAATETGDYAVGVLLARDKQARKYRIEDVVRVRAEPAEIERVMRATARKDGDNMPQVVEKESGSAGKFAMRDIRHRIFKKSPVFEVAPTGNKMTRARLAASLVAADAVELAPGVWNQDFTSELVGFPAGSHDDQVDAFAHAVHWLVRIGGQDKPKNPITQTQDQVQAKTKRLPHSRLRIVR